MNKKKRIRIIYGIAIMSLVAIGECVYIAFRSERLSGNMGSTQGAVLEKIGDNHYVGDESCRSCHTQAYKEWKNSFHDLAMAEADQASVKGDFNTSFISQGVTNRFFREDGEFFVNTEGPDGAYHDYKIMFTFGVAPLQQYIVKFPDGRYQCLRTAWDTEKNQWFDLYPNDKVDPDEWLHWSRGGLNWNTMCADCHSTNVRKNFNEETGGFNTTFSAIDVGCEACHGPGKRHVDAAAARTESAGYGNVGFITALRGQAQVEQCAQCHARRTQLREGFKPGDNLMNYYVAEILRDDIYYPDGQIREEVYEYGSFLQSKMYRRGVRCADCHNPHSLKLKGIGNNLCGQCHSRDVYDTKKHHFHDVNTEASQCVSCHMPGRTYMGNDFRRDHSLRAPRPDLSVTFDTPNACNQCHANKNAAWAAEAIVKWYGPERKRHFSEALTMGSTRSAEAIDPLIALLEDADQPAIARATAVWYLDQIVTAETVQAIVRSLESPDAIVRYTAVNALSDLPAEQKGAILPLLRDTISAVANAAASSLADIPADQFDQVFRESFQTNIRAYEKSLEVRADFPGGQLEKGMFYSRTGRIELAEKAYLMALKLDNRFNAARVSLAHLYNGQGRNQEAIALFKTVIAQEPAFGSGYYSLGLLYAEENKLTEAIPYLSRAATLEKNPRVYYNLGLALQRSDRRKEAEKAFLQGLTVDAEDAELMYALSVLYIQQRAYGKAQPYVKKLIERYPASPQIIQLKETVFQGMGLFK